MCLLFVIARLEESQLAVLSHASGESGVNDFAERIAGAVRELGLHHPRSKSDRFVTVTYRIGVVQGEEERGDAQDHHSEGDPGQPSRSRLLVPDGKKDHPLASASGPARLHRI